MMIHQSGMSNKIFNLNISTKYYLYLKLLRYKNQSRNCTQETLVKKILLQMPKFLFYSILSVCSCTDATHKE